MKQVYSLTRAFRLICVAAIFIYLAANAGYGQGLFRQYDFAQSGFFGKHIEELPDGNYRVVFNNLGTFYGSGAFRHIMLTTNTLGEIIDSQQVNFTGELAFWLNDMTFVQPRQDWMQGDSAFTLSKINLQGDTLWSTPFILPSGYYIMVWSHAERDAAGNVWLAGVWFNGAVGGDVTRLVLVKVALDGQLLWTKVFPPTQMSTGILEGSVKFSITPDQDCILKYASESLLGGYGTDLLYINTSGELIWQQYFTDSYTPSGIYDFKVKPDKTSLLLGSFGDKITGLDSVGNIIFTKSKIGSLPATAEPYSAIATQDGNWVVAGRIIDPPYPLFTAKLSASGEVIWTKLYQITTVGPYCGVETAEGDLLWAGGPPFLIRMDSNGVIFKNHLAGRLAFDADVDCAVQSNESGIPNWLLKLEGTGNTQYAVAEPDGSYYFAQVDTGQQALTPIVQNYLWESCQLPYSGYIPPDSSDYTLTVDAPVQSAFDCPVMTVDLAAPFLRYCVNNTYAIRCCNYGNQTAADAYVEVYLPPHLLVQGASAPFTQNGQQLTFELGDVNPFECIDIQLVVKPDCDSTELGQSMCVSAHIFPDSLCGTFPGWSGALIEVSAACDGDSVRFEIQNTGNAPTSQPLDFIVIDDHVMTLQSTFDLLAQASHTEAFPADGSTWRLLAEQEPNAPGASIPSVAVEGCMAGNGGFTTGLILQWPNENGSPFWERDCHEIVGSFDPNAKQAAPAGVADMHWIKPNTPVEYLIQFQNTGTDTAFTVELRDTLSPWLRPESIRPGAASHPYSWSLSGDGVLRFLFENILLPDSTTNEAASHGFVKFRIEQQPDLPDGTLLENNAGIYFDFNEPVLTNTVFHTVGRDFIPTVSVNNPVDKNLPGLAVYPNPARDAAFVFLKNQSRQEGRLTLFDLLGRVVLTVQANNPLIEIHRQGMASGVYGLQWEGTDGSVFHSTLIWR